MTKQERMRLLLIDFRAFLRNDSMDGVYEKGRREGLLDAINELLASPDEPPEPQCKCDTLPNDGPVIGGHVSACPVAFAIASRQVEPAALQCDAAEEYVIKAFLALGHRATDGQVAEVAAKVRAALPVNRTADAD